MGQELCPRCGEALEIRVTRSGAETVCPYHGTPEQAVHVESAASRFPQVEKAVGRPVVPGINLPEAVVAGPGGVPVTPTMAQALAAQGETRKPGKR